MIDVSEHFPDCMKAEQEGKNVLIITRLDCPIERFDGKKAGYRLEFRWLSNPDNLVSVQGNDFTYWLRKEWNPNKGLFEQFQLF